MLQNVSYLGPKYDLPETIIFYSVAFGVLYNVGFCPNKHCSQFLKNKLIVFVKI